MSYKAGDLIWAKMKGYPHWPARIDLVDADVRVPHKRFPIFFYGTHETAFMQAKDLCRYEENKSKYYVQKKLRGFQEGLMEIEKDPLIKYGGRKKNNDNKLSRHHRKVKNHEETDDTTETGSTKVEKKESSGNITRKLSRKQHEESDSENTPREISKKRLRTSTIATTQSSEDDGDDEVYHDDNGNTVDDNQGGDDDMAVTIKEQSATTTTEDEMTKEEFERKRQERYQKKKELLKEKKRQQKLEQKKAEKLALERDKELLKRMPTVEQILERFLYDLKLSLTVESPDVSRCIKIMGQIQNLDITAEMVQNSTELIPTIKKIRKYKGSDEVGEKANELYQKLKSFFLVSNTDQSTFDTGVGGDEVVMKDNKEQDVLTRGKTRRGTRSESVNGNSS